MANCSWARLLQSHENVKKTKTNGGRTCSIDPLAPAKTWDDEMRSTEANSKQTAVATFIMIVQKRRSSFDFVASSIHFINLRKRTRGKQSHPA
jgi:hypothetical protein